MQENYWFFILFFGLCGLIIITFLLETNRAPFDLPEAESELVTGYTTEFGGFFFRFILFRWVFTFIFFFISYKYECFFGGWELPNFLLNVFYNYKYNLIII